MDESVLTSSVAVAGPSRELPVSGRLSDYLLKLFKQKGLIIDHGSVKNITSFDHGTCLNKENSKRV